MKAKYGLIPLKTPNLMFIPAWMKYGVRLGTQSVLESDLGLEVPS